MKTAFLPAAVAASLLLVACASAPIQPEIAAEQPPPRDLIAEAINVVVYIAGRGRKRRIETIAHVTGHDSTDYHLVSVNEPLPELPTPSPPSAADSPSSTQPGDLP